VKPPALTNATRTRQDAGHFQGGWGACSAARPHCLKRHMDLTRHLHTVHDLLFSTCSEGRPPVARLTRGCYFCNGRWRTTGSHTVAPNVPPNIQNMPNGVGGPTNVTVDDSRIPHFRSHLPPPTPASTGYALAATDATRTLRTPSRADTTASADMYNGGRGLLVVQAVSHSARYAHQVRWAPSGTRHILPPVTVFQHSLWRTICWCHAIALATFNLQHRCCFPHQHAPHHTCWFPVARNILPARRTASHFILTTYALHYAHCCAHYPHLDAHLCTQGRQHHRRTALRTNQQRTDI